MESLFIRQKKTLITGFVAQGHILIYKSQNVGQIVQPYKK